MERICITPLYGMGDTLMTTPAVELLKKYRSDVDITYFVFNTSNHQLLKNNPFIDTLWYYPIKFKLSKLVQGSFHILNNFTFRYNTCINFYPSNKMHYNLLCLLTGAHRRIGHTYLNKNISELNWLKNLTIHEDSTLHCVEENVNLLKFFGITVDHSQIPPMRIYLTEEEKKEALTTRKNLTSDTIIGMHTGTSTYKGQSKRRWPKEHFIELINNLQDTFIILFGSGDEIELNLQIQAAVKKPNNIYVLQNKTLRQVISLIGCCNAFVSNDSGLMHIAAAMNVPTVAILGPTNPVYIRPWKVRHEVVRLNLPCSPCYYYSPRPLRCSLNNSFKCLVDLDAEKVTEAVMRILS